MSVKFTSVINWNQIVSKIMLCDVNIVRYLYVAYVYLALMNTVVRLWNTGLVSSRVSLTCSALVGGVAIKMPYGVDVLHRPALHPIFSYWVG